MLVKLYLNGNEMYGEVHYYFRLQVDEKMQTVALISPYTPPDPSLLALSSKTLKSCQHLPNSNLIVVNIRAIHSVVAMVPHSVTIPGHLVMEDRWFVVEKPGLDVANMGGIIESTVD